MRQGIRIIILRSLNIDTATHIGRIVLNNRTADKCIRLEVQTTTVILGLVVLNNAVTYVCVSRNNGSGTYAVLGVRSIGMTVLDEQTVKYNTLSLSVLLVRQESQLTAVVYHSFVDIIQVVGEGNNVVALTFSTCTGGDTSGQNRTVRQRVAVIHNMLLHRITHINDITGSVFVMVEPFGKAALHNYTVRNDKRVVERIVGIARSAIFGRAYGRVTRCIVVSSRRIGLVTLKPYLYRPALVRQGRSELIGYAFAIYGRVTAIVKTCRHQ